LRQGLNKVARKAKGSGARGAEATLGAHASPLPQSLLLRTTCESPAAAPQKNKSIVLALGLIVIEHYWRAPSPIQCKDWENKPSCIGEQNPG